MFNSKDNKQHTYLAKFTHLILIKAAVLVLLFTLILKRDDNKTYKDVDHEEGNDDDVDDVVNCHQGSVVV